MINIAGGFYSSVLVKTLGLPSVFSDLTGMIGIGFGESKLFRLVNYCNLPRDISHISYVVHPKLIDDEQSGL
jgi:hypothetical protein